jgi:hypothetical protein
MGTDSVRAKPIIMKSPEAGDRAVSFVEDLRSHRPVIAAICPLPIR